MIRAKIAIVLMIVPLLLAIAIRYWPSSRAKSLPEISRIAMLAPEVHGEQKRQDVAGDLTAAIRDNCDGKENLRILASSEGQAADALLQSAITLDAGLIEIDLQLVDPRTNRILWRDAYQAKQDHSTELMRTAAQSLLQALRG